MNPSFSLSIPKPCSENWNSFTPTSTGGFCGSCQKNVIDFTKATDEEIIAFISHDIKHTCGRFRIDQLKAYPHQKTPSLKPGLLLLKAGVASLLLLLVSKPSSAEIRKDPHAVVRSIRENQSFPIDSIREVHGVVRDTNQQVLSGVNIVLTGTAVGTFTDQHGRYSLSIPAAGGTLTFSYISFKTKHVLVTDQDSIDVIMIEDPTMLEEITVVAGGLTVTRRELIMGSFTKRESWLRRVFNRIGQIF